MGSLGATIISRNRFVYEYMRDAIVALRTLAVEATKIVFQNVLPAEELSASAKFYRSEEWQRYSRCLISSRSKTRPSDCYWWKLSKTTDRDVFWLLVALSQIAQRRRNMPAMTGSIPQSDV